MLGFVTVNVRGRYVVVTHIISLLEDMFCKNIS